VLPERIEVIRNFPLPKNLKAVRRFLGMVGFYGCFIERFSQIAEPLHALKRKNARFVWGEAQQAAFERLSCQPHELANSPHKKEFWYSFLFEVESINPWATVQLEGLGQLKNLITSLGI
jgi:hypothetical protein